MIFVSRKTMPPEPPVVESPTKKNGIDLKTEACAFPAIAVDGSDAVAVYRVAHEAIAHARMGHGPTLIECLTDGSNPADPILNMEKYLIRKGLFTEELKTEVIGGFSRELDAALEAASACPSSNPSTRLASC
jgi:pyruvate dehydrogenase E1 component alpha subunit